MVVWWFYWNYDSDKIDGFRFSQRIYSLSSERKLFVIVHWFQQNIKDTAAKSSH